MLVTVRESALQISANSANPTGRERNQGSRPGRVLGVSVEARAASGIDIETRLFVDGEFAHSTSGPGGWRRTVARPRSAIQPGMRQ